MIITGVGERTIGVLFDGLEAKMLVEVLRKLSITEYKAASEELLKNGFPVMAQDVVAASLSLCSQVGRITDQFAWIKPTPQATAAIGVAEEHEEKPAKPPTIQ